MFAGKDGDRDGGVKLAGLGIVISANLKTQIQTPQANIMKTDSSGLCERATHTHGNPDVSSFPPSLLLPLESASVWDKSDYRPEAHSGTSSHRPDACDWCTGCPSQPDLHAIQPNGRRGLCDSLLTTTEKSQPVIMTYAGIP